MRQKKSLRKLRKMRRILQQRISVYKTCFKIHIEKQNYVQQQQYWFYIASSFNAPFVNQLTYNVTYNGRSINVTTDTWSVCDQYVIFSTGSIYMIRLTLTNFTDLELRPYVRPSMLIYTMSTHIYIYWVVCPNVAIAIKQLFH